MPYVKTVWVDDDGSGTTGTIFNAARMNNIENGIEALDEDGLPEGITDHGLVTVTELEAIEPVTGDRAHLIVGSGVWDLTADGDPGESGHPWSVSGPSLMDGTTAGTSTSSTTYTSLGSAPVVTIPIVGIYDIQVFSEVKTGAPGRGAHISYSVGATSASDAWSARIKADDSASLAEISNKARHSAAKNAVIKEQVRGEGGGIEYAKRSLWVDPVRVG